MRTLVHLAVTSHRPPIRTVHCSSIGPSITCPSTQPCPLTGVGKRFTGPHATPHLGFRHYPHSSRRAPQLWVWIGSASKADPRQQHDWILKGLQGERAHPLVACWGGDALLLEAEAPHVVLTRYPMVEALWGAAALQLAALVDAGNHVAVCGLAFTLLHAAPPGRARGERKHVDGGQYDGEWCELDSLLVKEGCVPLHLSVALRAASLQLVACQLGRPPAHTPPLAI